MIVLRKSRSRGVASFALSTRGVTSAGACQTLITVAIALLIGGCSNLSDPFVVDAATITNENKAEAAKPGPINLDTFTRKGETEPLYSLAIKNYANPDTAKKYRNELQALILKRSNRICRHHEGAIIGNSAVLNFSAGWLAAILASASAVVAGPTASVVLATTSAMVNTGRAELNAQFYQNTVASAIVKKIREGRLAAKAEIDGKRTDTIDDYTVEDAIRDADEYHFKCSFYEGLIALVEDGKKRMTQQEIDARIVTLTAENATIHNKLTNLQGRQSGAGLSAAVSRQLQRETRMVEHSLNLNQININRLQAQRASAPHQ